MASNARSSCSAVEAAAGVAAPNGGVAGGDDGTRTHDLLVANQALSQLSYVPAGSVVCDKQPGRESAANWRSEMVGLGGLEPPTLRLSGVRSNHLSYRPPRPTPRPWDTGSERDS